MGVTKTETMLGIVFVWTPKTRQTPFFIVIVAHTAKVNQTGGNRPGLTGYQSKRSDPILVWTDIKPVQI